MDPVLEELGLNPSARREVYFLGGNAVRISVLSVLIAKFKVGFEGVLDKCQLPSIGKMSIEAELGN